MKRMTLRQYMKIHADYRHVFLDGSRTYLYCNGSKGTCFAVEGVDFEIVG